MNKKILILLLSFISICFYSQQRIIFKYDASGNQIYRGKEQLLVSNLGMPEKPILMPLDITNEAIDEDELFWTHIQLYPVPVSSVLTVRWDTEVNDLVDSVTLYNHNQLINLFTQRNIPNLNYQVEINMKPYRLGVYILSFQLKDGRVLTKNIIKE
ncbi:hypothetical protein [Riemerella columbina]|uniref:hypothetical protein n=1 Tax=Riemerella columbina TaxID=103810 RepID=UPI002670A396|nr:hypothetical protein [Riemerella columbina]WKS95297.1 hypothetical protein NYR17_00735 [Riemerella columbina]